MALRQRLTNVLIPYQVEIDALIQSYVAALPPTGRLTEACAYALLNGGKRFRPAMVLMVAKALGRAGQANQAALAIEFFHTASLIADDLPCMDDDDERRQLPSLHRAFDEATALLASYALISAGYERLAQNGRNLGVSGGEIALLALENVATNTGIQGATGGQWLDLFPPHLNEETFRQIMHRKTGALFEVAFVLGWLFGGGNLAQLRLVKKAAAHFGMAFQTADDLGDQKQDAVNASAVNLAVLLGPEKAVASIRQDLAQFSELLIQLKLQDSDLAVLGDLLLDGLQQPV